MIQFAKTEGINAVIVEKLFYANFTESEDVGYVDTLVAIVPEGGLNKVEVLGVFQDKLAYGKEVQADIEQARQVSVTSVPFFLINKNYTLSGAQPKGAFIQT